MSIPNQEARVTPKDAAENLLGTIRWEDDETKGFCLCPGAHLHHGRAADRDCVVYLNDIPTIFCLHQSCKSEVEEATRALRSAIAGGQPSELNQRGTSPEAKRRLKEAQRRHQLELRGRSSHEQILKEHRWIYADIQRDTKDVLASDLTTHGRHILDLFRPDDVVWIGDKYDSGSSRHEQNFKPAEEWLQAGHLSGQLTCPAAFRTGSISRSNDNVLHRRFLVVESDVLSKDEVGAVFRWLRDEVGLNLRAVVDTAGKSLHGWFDYPKKAVLDQLAIILPQLGCDPGLFRASQPCRMPGALRDGKYQKLVYLDKTPPARTAKLPAQALPLPELYYFGHGQCYYRQAGHGGWQKINEKSLDTDLKARGYSFDEEPGMVLPEGVQAKRALQLQHDVGYAGRLAGYLSGHYTSFGRLILVTESPVIIEPKAGSWDTIRRLVDGLFKDGNVDQTPYFYGWLKTAYESLRSGNFTPGQVLTIAGVKDCGKSRVQNLITDLLGGRVAKPYHFMTGKSHFNSELFGAEHLMIEDEPASTRIEARRNLGAMIKTVTVNDAQTCYTKMLEGISLRPFWRLSITMNDEPEDLMVLPPFDEGIEDKIILLKAFRQPMPMPTDTPEQKAAFRRQLVAEVPAFLDFLTHWEIPVHLKNNRFGIATYHHPDLLEKVAELAPEQRLLALIDQCPTLFPIGGEWRGTALKLEQELTDNVWPLHHQGRTLLQHQNTCGTLLGRLASQQPGRVSTDRVSNGHKVWKITRGGTTKSWGEVTSGTVEQISSILSRMKKKEEGSRCMYGECPLVCPTVTTPTGNYL